MLDLLINIEPHSNLSFQNQIREKIISLIHQNQIGETPLPSSRKLANQLGVSRNTVTLAYESLIDDGYLVSVERSGFYINSEAISDHAYPKNKKSETLVRNDSALNWCKRMHKCPATLSNVKKDYNWSDYPYPFVYGQVDPQAFPLDQWRSCNRWVQTKGLVHKWVDDHFDEDDTDLVKSIRQHILTARGIFAEPEEILITLGTQNSVFMLSQLIINKHTKVGVENPGYIDFRNILKQANAEIIPLDVDKNGIVQDKTLSQCDYIITTPSHQYPTTVSMPVEHRKSLLNRAAKDDFVIIEDDYESEINFTSAPIPALKSMDAHDRVIYCGSLSKSISPGLRIGYIVANKYLIEQLKAVRRLNYRHPPANNQRATALFISQGYYASHIRKMKNVYSEKWQRLSKSLKQYLPSCKVTETQGSFCFWVRLPEGVSSAELAGNALKKGVLIEEGDNFFVEGSDNKHGYIRLGYSAIPLNNIETGIKLIGDAIEELI